MTDENNNIELTARIVEAYVSHNKVDARDLPTLIGDVHAALDRIAQAQLVQERQAQKPAVAISKSVTPDFIVCLEDGREFKSLKRHLQAAYSLSPEEYRAKWNLPHDYPMVAPNYAKARSKLAKQMGLGRDRRP